MINRNKELSLLWIIWRGWVKINLPNTTWDQYLSLIENLDSNQTFSSNLNQLIEKWRLLHYLPSLFDWAKETELKWNKDGIKSILKEDFSQFESLKRIESAPFFFYKGDINLLKQPTNEFVSVVGSRKTNNNYMNWIIENVPNNKIIVSGLATGADVLGHKYAMDNNQKIVIFPAFDIYKFKPLGAKLDIYNYGLSNGVILTDVIPESNSCSKINFLKRNKWMAQMVDEAYVVYFEGMSGTLSHMLEVAKKDGIIIMSKEVLEINKSFLRGHNIFKTIFPNITISDYWNFTSGHSFNMYIGKLPEPKKIKKNKEK